MRARLRRLATRLAIAAGIAGVLLVALAWGVASTDAGLQLAWRLAQRRLPDGVRIDSVHGRLRGPVELDGIRYADERSDVRVARARLDWRIMPIGRGLLVRDATVEEVRITSLPADGKSREPSAPPAVTLPFALRVERAVVRDIELRSTEGEGATTVVDSVSIARLAMRSELSVDSVVAGVRGGRVEASGSLAPRGRYPFELAAAWSLPDSALGVVAGSLRATGDLDSLRLVLDVSRPARLRLAGGIDDPTGARILDAHVTLDDTDLRALRRDAPEGRAAADFDLRGTIDALDADGTARVTVPATGLVAVEAALRVRGDTVRLDRLRALADSTRLDVDGDIVLGDREPHLLLDVSWTRARWPLRDEMRVFSDSGSARLEGTTADLQVVGDASVEPAGWPAHRARLRGRATEERIRIDEMRVEGPAIDVSGRGVLSWSPDPRWDLELAGARVVIERLVPDSATWNGRVSFMGRTRGSLIADVVAADFTVDTVQGDVRGARVDASAAGSLRVAVGDEGVDWREGTLSLHWLEARWGENRAFVAGTFADSASLHGTLYLPDLAIAYPAATGALEARGRLHGARSAPELEASVFVRDLETDSFRIAEASAEGLVESAAGGTVDVTVLGAGIAYGERGADSLEIRVRGTKDEHDVQGRVRGTDGATAELAASGRYGDRAWAGRLQRLDVVADRLGSWRMVDTVAVFVSADSARLDRACWTSSPARLCADGSWAAAGASSAAFELEGLPVERLPVSLPAGWSLTGAVGATGNGAIGADGTVTTEARADFGSGQLRYPTAEGERALSYSDATARLTVDADGARSELGGTLTDDRGTEVAALSGTLSLPEYLRVTDTLRTQPVTGALDAHVEDLSALDALLGDVGLLTGVLRLDVDVSGTVERPAFLGEASLRGGSMEVPDLGLQLGEIELTASGQGQQGITVEGSLVSGTGRLTFGGDVPALPSAERPARIRLTGTRVQAVALPEAEVWVSPDLVVTASPQRLGIAGDVRVPIARIDLGEISESAVRPSQDVVFVGDTAEVARRLRTLGVNVRVELGDSVSFRGYGFSAQPRGSLLASEGPGGTTTATGEITLADGRYRAYGQELTIDRGRFLFAGGPIENPGLDVRASRTADDGVVAGLQVSGTLRRPEVTIFSDPVMMESEALAYIVLGRPLGTATTTEGNRVANAAASLGIREGNALASRIGQRFGLAEVRVAADGPLEEASLIAGKYLSPTLYVSYGVGLFEPISSFRLRYLLSGHWTLRAETGESEAVDVLYRIERGR